MWLKSIRFDIAGSTSLSGFMLFDSSAVFKSYICQMTVLTQCAWPMSTTLHRGAFYQFPFRWIYYCYSSKSTGKETGKTHLCMQWIDYSYSCELTGREMVFCYQTFSDLLLKGAFCQFPFHWIYYYSSNKSTEKETGKSHLCEL